MSPPAASSLLAAAVIACPAAALHAQAWQVDSSVVAFEVRNAGLPVHGTIAGLAAKICFDPHRPERGRIDASVDPSTIDTGIGFRDRHLRRSDWFDVSRFDRIRLRSTTLRRSDAGFAGRFVLGIRDVEREVEIPFRFAELDEGRARLAGEMLLDRLAWGLGRPSPILANEVRVIVTIWARAAEETGATAGQQGEPCEEAPVSRHASGLRDGSGEPAGPVRVLRWRARG